MIRRLIRWLARKEIELAYEAGSEMARAMVEANTALIRRIAYAEGEMAGRQQMHDAVHDIVEARTAGMGDLVSAEDLERAKRGLLH